MNNAEPHTGAPSGKQSNESNWTDLPLFSPNAAAPPANAAPQISNLLSRDNLTAEPPPEINAEPRKHAAAFEMHSSPLIADPTIIENPESSRRANAAPGRKEQKENAVPRSLENAAPPKTKKAKKVKTGKAAELLGSPKTVRRRKSRPKSGDQKVRSQKRNTVPLKAFASPSEKAELENKAKNIGCSLSNYIRLHLGLPFNEAGRKKRKNRGGI